MNGIRKSAVGFGGKSLRRCSQPIKTTNKSAIEQALGLTARPRSAVRMDILRASLVVPLAMKLIKQSDSSVFGIGIYSRILY